MLPLETILKIVRDTSINECRAATSCQIGVFKKSLLVIESAVDNCKEDTYYIYAYYSPFMKDVFR